MLAAMSTDYPTLLERGYWPRLYYSLDHTQLRTRRSSSSCSPSASFSSTRQAGSLPSDHATRRNPAERATPATRLRPSGSVCDDLWVGQRVSLVTLGVTDLARARSFYEALGWHDARQPDDEVCFFQAGGMVFGLWTALGGHGAPRIELAHNVRSPEEVGAALADAERAGGTARPPGRPSRMGR
jgi:uncharacterized protein